MDKTALLAGTALLALTAGALAASRPGAMTKTIDSHPIQSGGNILYSQNSDYAYSIISQNFTSGSLSSYDTAAADDFVVPKGKTWTVTRVDVAGIYFKGSGPASSEVITFYKNNHGHPGKVVGKPMTVNCTDNAGSFACKIGRRKLAGGTKDTRYWLSVVANCDYNSCGEWGWTQTSTHKNPGQWENPGGGLGTTCSTWNNTSSCLTQSGVMDDYAFDLKGKSS